jgi:hypothetical protein
MHPDDLLLLAILGVVVVVTIGVILLALSLNAKRKRVFVDMARARNLEVGPLPGPWTGPVARGTVDGSAVEIGPVVMGPSDMMATFIRFRTGAPRLPRGLYVHSQGFRYNAAGPKSPASAPYDGSADDPVTRSLVANVPEIVLGDEALDRAFVIQSDDEGEVRRLFAARGVREAMLAAAATGAHVRLRGSAVELDVSSTDLGSVDAYSPHVRQLLALARTLGG